VFCIGVVSGAVISLQLLSVLYWCR